MEKKMASVAIDIRNAFNSTQCKDLMKKHVPKYLTH